MSIHHKKIITLKGHVNITGHFCCITENVVYCLSCSKCPSTVYIEETGRRLADRFREHRRDVINGKNELPVPAHFNQTNHILEDMKAAVLKAGLANQENRRSCGWFSNMGLCVLVALIKTQVSRESHFFAYSPAGSRFLLWHARENAIRHVS